MARLLARPGGNAVALALLVTSSSLFGASAIFAKLSYAHGCGVLTLLGARYLGSALVTLPLARWQTPRAWREAERPWLWGVVGVFNIASAGLYMGALSYDDVGRIAPIVFVFPALIAALGWLHFRYPVGRKLTVALLVGVTGTILVFGSDIGAPSKVLAGVLAVLTAFAASYYFITAARFTPTHWLAAAATAFTMGAVFFVPLAAATGSGLPHGIGWLWLACLVVLGGVVPYTLQLSSLSRVGSTRGGVIAMLEPVVSVVLAFIVLDEQMKGLQAAGAALVLGALVLATVPLRARRRRAAAA